MLLTSLCRDGAYESGGAELVVRQGKDDPQRHRQLGHPDLDWRRNRLSYFNTVAVLYVRVTSTRTL